MREKHEDGSELLAGDSYDLAVGLRRRLAGTERPESASVASQLQFAARQRLGSDPTVGRRARRARRRAIQT